MQNLTSIRQRWWSEPITTQLLLVFISVSVSIAYWRSSLTSRDIGTVTVSPSVRLGM